MSCPSVPADSAESMEAVALRSKFVTLEPSGDYIAHGRLANGLRVAVRPLHAEDRDAVRAGFAVLSERSRNSRFVTSNPSLNERELHVLVDDVDQHDHVALMLVWCRSGKPDVLLGEGRFIRLHRDPTIADASVTIGDDIQGLGAGRFLTRVLADVALDLGVERFTATMTATNTASFRLMQSIGTITQNTVASGAREVVVDLTPGVPATRI